MMYKALCYSQTLFYLCPHMHTVYSGVIMFSPCLSSVRPDVSRVPTSVRASAASAFLCQWTRPRWASSFPYKME